MGTWNPGDLEEVLKRLYPKGISEVLAPECALFKRLKKDSSGLRGEGRYVSVVYGGAAGVSADFTTAQSSQNPASYQRFFITRKKIYGLGSLTGEWLEAAKGGEASLVDGLKESIERTAYSVGHALAVHLYGDGTGTVGVIKTGSDVSTDTVTLTEPTDALKFEPGLQVQLWDGSSSSLRDGGKKLTVKAVDLDLGTITVDQSWNTISGATVGDKIVRAGDFGTCGVGLAAWLPTTAPTSGDNFFGVDRSVNPTRLAGIRVTNPGSLAIDELLIKAANLCAFHGGKPDFAVMNHLDFAELVLTRQSHLQIKAGTNVDTMGFEAFKIIGPRGVIEVVPDSYCPRGRSYLLDTSSWTIGSAGELPFLEQRDGTRIFRSATTDGFEFRMIGYWNLWTNAPGKNAVVTF